MDEFKKMNREINKKRLDKEYFIDRFGRIHKYKGDLCVIASDLYPDVKNAKDYVMNLGWVMVGSVVYSVPIVHKKPSQSQINTLYDIEQYDYLCILYNNRYIKYKDNQNLF